MKKCSYCGGKNSDDAARCSECGTEFVVPSVDAPPARPRDATSLIHVLRLAGTIVLLSFFYLLSFGPVERYCCPRTVVPSPPSLVSGSDSGQSATEVQTVTMRYPAWVSFFYRPVFWMLSGGGGNGLYGRYLQWWEKLPGQEP